MEEDITSSTKQPESPICLKGGESHKDTSFTWKNITKLGNHCILIKISSHILDDAFKPKKTTQHVLPNLFIASLNQLADQGQNYLHQAT